jgi:hypothetical protein
MKNRLCYCKPVTENGPFMARLLRIIYPGAFYVSPPEAMSLKPFSQASGIAKICSVPARTGIRHSAKTRGRVGIDQQSGFFQFYQAQIHIKIPCRQTGRGTNPPGHGTEDRGPNDRKEVSDCKFQERPLSFLDLTTQFALLDGFRQRRSLSLVAASLRFGSIGTADAKKHLPHPRGDSSSRGSLGAKTDRNRQP